MPRVGRVRVSVEIVDDDGSTSIHEAVGVPRAGSMPRVSIVPHHRGSWSRRAGALVAVEVVEVGVSIEAVLVAAEGLRLFGVDRMDVEPVVPAIAERPRSLDA